jgi:ribonuclease P/MRP protein subunit RPP1
VTVSVGPHEAVHAHPDGGATVARHALTAAELGYEGLLVRNHGDAPAEYDPVAVGETYGVDVVRGVEIRTDDRGQAASLVSRYRSRTLVCVHGGDDAINRFAAEEPRVDVLSHPMADGGDLNHVIAEAAAANGVRVEFDLSPVLHRTGGSRVQAVGRLQKLADLVADADCPYVVSATPGSHLDWRAPRELVAVAERCGFDPEWTRDGLAEWGRLAARNRDRLDEDYLEPGVRRGRYEDRSPTGR